MLGFLKYLNPIFYFRTIKESVIAIQDISRMKTRDRYLAIFWTWVICKMKEDFKIPDKKLSEYMREWEANPDKIMMEWELGKFGLSDLGYDVYPPEEDDQVSG